MEKENTTENKKPSYNELLLICRNLNNQLRQTNDALTIIPIYFKVLELKDNFNKEFVEFCSEQITSMLYNREESSKE